MDVKLGSIVRFKVSGWTLMGKVVKLEETQAKVSVAVYKHTPSFEVWVKYNEMEVMSW